MPRGVYERSGAARSASAENLRRARAARKRVGWPAAAHASEKQAARVSPEERAERWPRWRAANPEKAAQANTNSGLVSTALAWLCHDCGPAIGKHQKATGHEGRTRLDTQEEA